MTDGPEADSGSLTNLSARFAQTFSALTIPSYRYFWISAVAATTAMQVQMFGRGLLAYELGGSASSIGIVILGQSIPQFAFSMVGGTFADRIDRRRLIMGVQLSKAVLAIIVTVMVMSDVMTVPMLVGLGLIQGLILAFSGPARQAIVPELVGQRHLMNAIALSNTAMNLSRIGAPSLAAGIVSISWVDLEGIFMFQAGLDILALAVLFMLPALSGGKMRAADRNPGDVRPVSQHASGRRAVYREMLAGYSYIRTSPILVTLLAIGLVPTLLGQSYQQLLPVFAKDVFGNGIDRNAGVLGVMGTMSGVGALAGSLAVASLADYKRRTLLQIASGLGFGLFLVAFALQSHYAPALILLVGVGFNTAFLQSLNSTMILSATDPAYHGRVMSVNMLNFAFSAIGTFVIGYVIDWLARVTLGPFDLEPVQIAYVGAGLLITLFMLSVTVMNPSYRRLEQNDLRSFAETRLEAEPEVSV